MAHTLTYRSMKGAEFQDPMPGVSNGKLAMWLFLVSDAMSFIGLLVAYAAVRWTFPEELSIPKGLGTAWKPDEWFGFFGIQLTALNTFILICSSVTMVQALAAFQAGNLKHGRAFLAATVLGGSVFLGVQAYEWTHMIHEVGMWTESHNGHKHYLQFDPKTGHGQTTATVITSKEGLGTELHTHHLHMGEDGHLHLDEVDGHTHKIKNHEVYGEHIKHVDYNLQAATFYITTGFHGAHVLGGVILLLLTLVWGMLGHKRWLEPNTVEVVGLYWHFVDLVWILIFTFVYLI